MRRLEVQATLMEAIEDHFPADVAEKFREDQLGKVASLLQDEGKDEYGAIDKVVRDVATEAKGKDFDAIADGDVQDTAKWLHEQIYV
jgi:hypothetical protein